MKKSKIILALDTDDFKKIKNLIKELKNHIYGVKVGYQFFFNFGEKGYSFLKKNNLNIFFDFKLHDIPNTVAMGISSLNRLDPDMLTVHISGGKNMLVSANKNSKNTKIIGVSILTSLDKKNIFNIYNRKNTKTLIKKMVSLAIDSKIYGIVCSPKEVKYVKEFAKSKLKIITPGIRLKNQKIRNDDQKRFLLPKEAIKLGADYLVIGRPIIASNNPLYLVKSINDQIG